MMNYLWVALGSAAGGMARYGCSGFAARHFGTAFPWGTLFVNVGGSLTIGVLAALLPLASRWPLAPDARALLMVGLCGGFTTFSSLSAETLGLARNGEWASAASYVLGTVVLCLLAVAAGYFGTTALQR